MRRPASVAFVCLLGAGLAGHASAQTPPAAGGLEQALRALVRSAGASAPPIIDAAGLTRSGRRLWSLESADAPDPSRPRLVFLGGVDGSPEGTAAVMRILQWWFTDPEAASLRGLWQIAALPCARPDFCGDGPVGAPDHTLTFPPAGGFFDTGADHERLITRPKDVQDNATPSGGAMATHVLLRLAALAGDGRYRSAAERAIAAVAALTHRRRPRGFAG